MRRPVALLTCGVLAACEAPSPPTRAPIYSYADTFNGAPQVFRWTDGWLPVRYYATPEGTLPELVRRGLLRWERQFLYGEFRAVAVGDSLRAEVVVAFEAGPPPPAEPDSTSSARACEGVTTLNVDGTNTLDPPIRVTLRWFSGFAPPEIAACLDRVVTHELGHTLGLINPAHAGTGATDLMFAFPTVSAPGPRDRATVEVLYHTAPTVALPPGR
ncbi:MAG TPA: hypothetical protein VNI61_01175 [Gemmatimonadales bacterium]|nr:hypothetical protein [Gemmatimonadales bacterium]